MDRKHKLKIKPIGLLRQGNINDGSSEDSPDLIQKQRFPKKEFQMDDSDCGTPRSLSRQGKIQKISKFRDFKANTIDIKQHEQTTEEEYKLFQNDNDESIAILTPQIRKKGPKEFIIGKCVGVMNSDSESKKLQALSMKKDKLANHPFRHLIFGPVVEEKMLRKHLELIQRGLLYSKYCLKSPSDKFIQQKQVALPDPEKNLGKLLLLDLDETLVHACGPKEIASVTIIAHADNGETGKIGINVRPHVDYFLNTVSKFFNVYLFTASSPAYATAIVDYLDPQQKNILGILTRGNCMETKNGFFIKDLRILKNRKLKDIIIVDNLSHSFGFQIENGVPILEWHSNQKDQELIYIANYLIEASKQEDIREFNRQKLRLEELSEFTLEQI